nr:hypothetical protein [Streptomyces thermolilacinus]
MTRRAWAGIAADASIPTTLAPSSRRATAAQNMPVPAPTSTTAGAGRGAKDPISRVQSRSDSSGISSPPS